MTPSEKQSSEHDKEQISNDEIILSDNPDDSAEINELSVVAEGEERTTWFVWVLVSCSTISGLLFGAFAWLSIDLLSRYLLLAGYDTGVISGALVTISSDLGPSQLSNGQKASLSTLSSVASHRALDRQMAKAEKYMIDMMSLTFSSLYSVPDLFLTPPDDH